MTDLSLPSGSLRAGAPCEPPVVLVYVLSERLPHRVAERVLEIAVEILARFVGCEFVPNADGEVVHTEQELAVLPAALLDSRIPHDEERRDHQVEDLRRGSGTHRGGST